MEKTYLIGRMDNGNEVFAKFEITDKLNQKTYMKIEIYEQKNFTLFGSELVDYLQEEFESNMDNYDKLEFLERYDCRYSEFGEYWYEELDMMETIEKFKDMLEDSGKEYDEVKYSSDFGEYYATTDIRFLTHDEVLKVEKHGDIFAGWYMVLIGLYGMFNHYDILTEEKEENDIYRKYISLMEVLEEL